jgi:D-alanyl-D-alanine carboxypeptidase/D-alanyl-D-alanine-endopeptidase (penicillin-binding protein 4)
MARLACLAAVLAAVLAPAAQAAGPEGTVRALDREMNRAGSGSGAYVVDLDSGAPLYARAPDVPRIPASVNKLYTTSTALLRYGPDGELTTAVRGDTTPDENGVLRGNLYLVGGGDPEFGPAEARELAQVLAVNGLRRVNRRVIGDESRFDALRGGPDSGYGVSEWVGPLSALSFNHAFTVGRHPRFQSNPAYYAARRFEGELRRAGVTVRWHARAGVAPASAPPLGEWGSARMAAIIRHTNRPSDNFMAETLLKDLGADFGDSGTTAAGAAVVRRQAAKLGARPQMVDGSGLSRENRTTPHDVVDLLTALDRSEVARQMRISLAIAGKAGTLSDRMRRSAAKGRCRAKTGTLNGVSNLAGYCDSRWGARVAFAFLMSGVSLDPAHAMQDRMAAALARYRP